MTHNQTQHNYVILLADLFTLILVYFISLNLAKNNLYPGTGITLGLNWQEFAAFLLFLFSWIVFSLILGLYDDFRFTRKTLEYIPLFKCIILQALFVLVTLFWLTTALMSRFFLVIYIPALLLALLLTRQALTIITQFMYKWGLFNRKVIMIGDTDTTRRLSQIMEGKKQVKYRIIGVLNNKVPLYNSEKYLGRIQEIDRILEQQEVDDVIISFEFPDFEELDYVISACEKYPVRIKIISRYSLEIAKKYQVTVFGDLALILLEGDPLNKFHVKFAKRLFDLTLSAVLFITVFLWLWPLVALGIKLTSRGPVFFKQERWGRKNRKITVYKFRSLRHVPEKSPNDKGFSQVTKRDPRVTGFGALLRKSSLDELPQFINVLKGEMSIVGPRPHPTPLNMESMGIVKNYLRRHLVKPGITGMAQVRGYRGETSKPELMQKRIEFDIQYIENWSLWLDTKIILLTVWNILKGEPNAF